MTSKDDDDDDITKDDDDDDNCTSIRMDVQFVLCL